MNIEIANRLVELRKKSGLSQEELASKLGLSRQAVSKWERAEASPDTDNLIVLAQIYHVSLDDLLSTDTPVDEIVQDVKDQQEEKKEEPKAVESEKDDDACLTPNQKIVKAIVHGVFDFLGILSFSSRWIFMAGESGIFRLEVRLDLLAFWRIPSFHFRCDFEKESHLAQCCFPLRWALLPHLLYSPRPRNELVSSLMGHLPIHPCLLWNCWAGRKGDSGERRGLQNDGFYEIINNMQEHDGGVGLRLFL